MPATNARTLQLPHPELYHQYLYHLQVHISHLRHHSHPLPSHLHNFNDPSEPPRRYNQLKAQKVLRRVPRLVPFLRLRRIHLLVSLNFAGGNFPRLRRSRKCLVTVTQTLLTKTFTQVCQVHRSPHTTSLSEPEPMSPRQILSGTPRNVTVGENPWELGCPTRPPPRRGGGGSKILCQEDKVYLDPEPEQEPAAPVQLQLDVVLAPAPATWMFPISLNSRVTVSRWTRQTPASGPRMSHVSPAADYHVQTP